MTNITPATHKGLRELIANNIEDLRQSESADDTLFVLRTNLDSVKQIYSEYIKKIKEVRELVELYNQLEHCSKANLRKAKTRKNGPFALAKTKLLFSIKRKTGYTLEITEVIVSDKNVTKNKPSLAPTLFQ